MKQREKNNWSPIPELLKAWNQKAFVNVIWSKFQDTRHSYGFELMVAEIGIKT